MTLEKVALRTSTLQIPTGPIRLPPRILPYAFRRRHLGNTPGVLDDPMALRPVRLDAHSVDLLAPDLDEHAMDYHAAVARALRRFEPYGRFVRDPEWALTSAGAVLLTPNAFRLELLGPTGSCTSSRPGTRERRRRSS